MPASLFQLSGDPGAPANPGWVRWAGGFVLGIAIGPWLASEGWVKEQPFIAGLAAAYTLSGLALLYSVASGEYAGAAWFIWMPIVVLAGARPDHVAACNQIADPLWVIRCASQQLLQLGDESLAEVRTLKRVGHVGEQEAEL